MELSDKQLEALGNALRSQERDEVKEGWLGLLWSEVPAQPQTLNQLVALGLLELSPYSSRAYKYYTITNKDKVRKIIDLSATGAPDVLEEDDYIIPHDMFDIIIGQDQTKNITRMALAASDPVHVLYVGEPATSKSLFLSELSRLPGSRLALGGTSSRAGIVDFLIDQRPRYLLIDEIEKANSNDLDVLLSLMEGGLVTRLKRGMREQVKLRTWVFAGANSDRYLSSALKSRFVTRRMPAYSTKDFEDISRAILIKREKVDPEWADKIIARLQGKTTDPRDSVKVGRMMQKLSDLDDIISAIW